MAASVLYIYIYIYIYKTHMHTHTYTHAEECAHAYASYTYAHSHVQVDIYVGWPLHHRPITISNDTVIALACYCFAELLPAIRLLNTDSISIVEDS